MSFNARILPLTVASALFMEQMDSTIIATSLPDIAKDLGTSPVSLKLAFTTYLLGLTVFLPISGWLADRFGTKRIFSLAIVVFTTASFACGFAQSLEHLIIARGMQGIGGALMVPVGRIIILRSVPKSQLLDAIAWLTIPALIGPVIGPPIGGFITDVYDWRWIFWLNLPFGLVALLLALWLMPNLKEEIPPPLDGRGFVLSGLGLALSVFGFTIIGRDVLPAPQTIAMIAAGLALLLAYGLHARKHPAPILDLQLLRIPTFRLSVVGGSLFRIPVGAVPFILPLLFQIGFGYTAFETGLITFTGAIGALVMKFTVAPILRRFGYRDVLIFNGLASAALFFAQAFFTAATPYAVMFAVLLVTGYLRSLQFSSLNTLAYAEIDNAAMARGNALYTVAQQLFLAVGVAFAATLLDASLWWYGRSELQAGDFTFALLITSLFALAAVVAYWRLPANAGAQMSGRAED